MDIATKNFLLIGLILLISSNSVSAQDRLFEFNLRGTLITSPSSYYNSSKSVYTGLGYSAEAQYFLKPRVAVGIYFSRSLGSVSNSDLIKDELYQSGGYEFLLYGLSGKITSHRNRPFQVYGTVRLMVMEGVYDYQNELGFSVGESGLTAGIGGGIILRITRSIGFNIVEINYNRYLSGFEFTQSEFSTSAFQVNSGIVYNFKERK